MSKVFNSTALETIILPWAKPIIEEAVETALRKQKAEEMKNKPPELWTKRQVCMYLKIHYLTLEKFIKQGIVKPIILGKQMRFDAEQLKSQMHEIRSHLYERK